jgi:hypothetical protein
MSRVKVGAAGASAGAPASTKPGAPSVIATAAAKRAQTPNRWPSFKVMESSLLPALKGLACCPEILRFRRAA